MIIVIEGADLVGKTTVINRLASEIQKSIPLKLEVVIDLDRTCLADIEKAINLTAYSIMSKDEDKVWLVDRFIISALVYSEFLGRKTKLTLKDIQDRDYSIIILGANDPILEERYLERSDIHFSIEQIKKLNNLFFTFFIKNQFNLNNMYYLKNNNQIQLGIIIDFVKNLIVYKNGNRKE